MRIARILNIDTELSELESKISDLREERAALLTEELAMSTGSNPPAAAPARAALPAEGAQPPRRRGRPPGKKNSQPAEGATPAPSKAKKKGRRTKARVKLSPEQAMEKVDAVVRAAGTEGISALQASKSSGLSYPIVAEILKAKFRKEGNRRDSRYYAD
jgi:hypothetical protein